MAESAQMQRLRRKAKKNNLQIFKLTGKNFFVLSDKNSAAGYKPPLTIDQLKERLSDNAK